jgi:hypothetical protein
MAFKAMYNYGGGVDRHDLNCHSMFHFIALVHIVPSSVFFFNPLSPTGHYTYRQFNIQQFYVLPTQCIYVLCAFENKQRLFHYSALTDWFL